MIARSKTSQLPPAVVLDAAGVAKANYETLAVELPEALDMEVKISVGWFPQAGKRKSAGWRGVASSRLPRQTNATGWQLTYGGRPYAQRQMAVMEAVELVLNLLIDRQDAAAGSRERAEVRRHVDALEAWRKNFAKNHTRITGTLHPAVVDASPAGTGETLSQDERNELVASLKQIEHGMLKVEGGWQEMAEGLAEISQRKLWRETHKTFNEWIADLRIKGRRLERSTAYELVHAWKMLRLFRAVGKSLPPIELDRPSHFKPFPADADAKDVRSIAEQIVKLVPAEGDGARRPTMREIKQAVKAEFDAGPGYSDEQLARIEEEKAWEREQEKKSEVGGQKSDPSDRTDASDDAPTASHLTSDLRLLTSESHAPRLAPETISGEYAEVVAAGDGWQADLDAFRAALNAALAPLLKKHGSDGKFLYAAAMLLHDMSCEVRYHQPEKPVNAAARRAK